MELYELLLNFINTCGFPIVCCGYMMITMNKTLKENTKAVDKLTILVDKLIHPKDDEIE